MASPTALIVGGKISPAAMSVAKARGLMLASCDPYPSVDELIAHVIACDAKALIIRMGKVPAEALQGLPGLRIIAKHGVGVVSSAGAEPGGSVKVGAWQRRWGWWRAKN